MPRLLIALLAAAPAAVLAVGLYGVAHRAAAPPGPAVTVALALSLGPALGVTLAAPSGRRLRRGLPALALTGVVGLLAWPVLAPGARTDAIVAGIGGLTGEIDPEGPVATTVRQALPPEGAPLAEAVDDTLVVPPGEPVAADAIVLPYEGEGRRLTVPVVFEHGGRTLETFMMLDTGATYTTLPSSVLQALGATPSADAPILTLTTANGQREAPVTLLDQVWLGDLVVPGVAITPCEDCAGDGADGLLGLNVAGGFNVTIDADRREVVFKRRDTFDRHLDIRPFADLDGRFTRYPAGRVEVALRLDNRSGRTIGQAVAHIRCLDETWRVVTGPIGVDEVARLTRRLPDHPPCPQYRIGLEAGSWAADDVLAPP